MAQVQITVTAELRDPEELFEDTQPSEVPEGAKTEQILLMVLNGIKNLGGFFRMSGDSITLTPIHRAKTIKVTVGQVSIVAGNDAAVKAAAQRAEQAQTAANNMKKGGPAKFKL